MIWRNFCQRLLKYPKELIWRIFFCKFKVLLYVAIKCLYFWLGRHVKLVLITEASFKPITIIQDSTYVQWEYKVFFTKISWKRRISLKSDGITRNIRLSGDSKANGMHAVPFWKPKNVYFYWIDNISNWLNKKFEK